MFFFWRVFDFNGVIYCLIRVCTLSIIAELVTEKNVRFFLDFPRNHVLEAVLHKILDLRKLR